MTGREKKKKGSMRVSRDAGKLSSGNREQVKTGGE